MCCQSPFSTTYSLAYKKILQCKFFECRNWVLFYGIFIKPPHFFLESRVPLWPIFDGIIFRLMSNFFGIALWFCVISLITFGRLVGPYWRWYLWTTMWTNLMLPMIINCITKYNISDTFRVYKTMKLIHQLVNNASIHVWHMQNLG